MHQHNQIRQLIERVGPDNLTDLISLNDQADCTDCQQAVDPQSLTRYPVITANMINRYLDLVIDQSRFPYPNQAKLRILTIVEELDLELEQLLVSDQRSCQVLAQIILTLADVNTHQRSRSIIQLEELRALALIYLTMIKTHESQTWLMAWQDHKQATQRAADREIATTDGPADQLLPNRLESPSGDFGQSRLNPVSVLERGFYLINWLQ